MKLSAKIVLVCAAWGVLSAQTVINGGRTITGTWDASGAASTKPVRVGSEVPATCSAGELFFNSTATPGQNIYLCQPSNVWTQLSGVSANTAATNLGNTFAAGTTQTFLGKIDASGGTATLPVQVAGSLPGMCSVGQLFLNTAATDTSRMLFICSATNVWTQSGYQQGTSAQIPVTCTVGQLYFATNATAGQNLNLCTSSNMWTKVAGGGTGPAGNAGQLQKNGGASGFAAAVSGTDYVAPDDVSTLRLYDDFCGDTAPSKLMLPWNLTGAALINSTVSEVQNHPCVIVLTTGTVSGNSAGASLENGGNLAAFYSLGGTSGFASWTARWIFMADHGANSGTNPFAVSSDSVGGYAGFITATQGSSNIPQVVPNAGIGVAWNSVAPSNPSCSTSAPSVAFNTADLMIVSTGGASTYCIDTGLAAQANVWYNVTFAGSPSGGATVCINGGNCGTVPAAQLSNGTMKPFLAAITNTTAAKNIWVDYFSFNGTGLVR